MEQCLDGTSGGTLFKEPEGLGGRTTFCVSIKGSEVFLSGGGGRGFSCCLLDALLICCDVSGEKIKQEPCYNDYRELHINNNIIAYSAQINIRI